MRWGGTVTADFEKIANFVDFHLSWGTRPTLIAAMLQATDVQDIVMFLSVWHFNGTATRLYEAWEIQRKALA
jgi:hypothetical protein